MAPPLGILCSNHMHKNIQNFLLQNHLAQVLGIWYVTLLKFVQIKVPGSKMVSPQGDLGLNHRITWKPIQKSSSEALAQIPEIRYVAFSSCLLSSLFK